MFPISTYISQYLVKAQLCIFDQCIRLFIILHHTELLHFTELSVALFHYTTIIVSDLFFFLRTNMPKRYSK